MHRQEVLPLSVLLEEFVEQQGIGLQMERVELFNAWDEVVGGAVAQRTTNKFFRDGILYCAISSSVVRSQLVFSLEAYRRELNEKMGKELVKKIVLK